MTSSPNVTASLNAAFRAVNACNRRRQLVTHAETPPSRRGSSGIDSTLSQQKPVSTTAGPNISSWWADSADSLLRSPAERRQKDIHPRRPRRTDMPRHRVGDRANSGIGKSSSKHASSSIYSLPHSPPEGSSAVERANCNPTSPNGVLDTQRTQQPDGGGFNNPNSGSGPSALHRPYNVRAPSAREHEQSVYLGQRSHRLPHERPHLMPLQGSSPTPARGSRHMLWQETSQVGSSSTGSQARTSKEHRSTEARSVQMPVDYPTLSRRKAGLPRADLGRPPGSDSPTFCDFLSDIRRPAITHTPASSQYQIDVADRYGPVEAPYNAHQGQQKWQAQTYVDAWSLTRDKRPTSTLWEAPQAPATGRDDWPAAENQPVGRCSPLVQHVDTDPLRGVRECSMPASPIIHETSTTEQFRNTETRSDEQYHLPFARPGPTANWKDRRFEPLSRLHTSSLWSPSSSTTKSHWRPTTVHDDWLNS